ncbi:uncharacterized protein DUF3626 [Kribbella sp. VKM Ac-2569]|uniref:DUF3626 domain-containing protein n=1 Tax=Kribbella sp. VKM Ac-2569 TaxID=2512220 RepID=UPI0010F2CBF0|nr:DUF3626 domain-containing protein [Kribbella sp. VKM Ac-2569]RZT17210.1 uncharacterized protein DUF3626 [Kribbella sp. VKM Ac-2569]
MITVQFHPNWPRGARTVIESIAADGVYQSQFATGISNGGLTAFRGGDRWEWESRLFSGRYDDQPELDRPVYGVWNRRRDVYGGAIRFGSSYLRLKPDTISRATFCFPDSARDPADFGDRSVLPQLCQLADDARLDDLDDYVEAHVHGPVRLSTDVEAVVLDRSFIGTPVEDTARELGCPIEYHPGFRAAPAAFDPAYRGPEIVDLARSLGPELTPDLLGKAAGGHPAQSIKYVWHYLARYGRQLTS